MATTLIQERDENGDMHDQDGNLRNAASQSCEPPQIDTSFQTSIEDRLRDMATTLIQERDENGDMHNQDGNLRNAASQRLDDQRDVISD
ncbi:hypothetical protein F2Q69_00052826 [Brassica cretica]|uniref:Uncharacterized protein n=1 Tax=Brassica cretica TaxID=69181 RepID=A0A8S9MW47_BRACR|nr:hypothetical protein F2Q69_00052826 [Brassica cretica]